MDYMASSIISRIRFVEHIPSTPHPENSGSLVAGVLQNPGSGSRPEEECFQWSGNKGLKYNFSPPQGRGDVSIYFETGCKNKQLIMVLFTFLLV